AALRVRRGVRDLRAEAEPPAVPLGALISEFAVSVRRAASFPEAMQVALATLRERAGAQSIMLLEKVSATDYRCANCELPARGFLLNRLAPYPHPLAVPEADFQAGSPLAQGLPPP